MRQARRHAAGEGPPDSSITDSESPVANQSPITRFHRDQSGQVSLLLVFMVLTLATLIFFVFNTGDQVNQVVMAQNAADSAALAGANWLAHGYNVLAMNNVASAKIIAIIAMLEAIGPSVQESLPNAEAILPWIEAYPSRLPGFARGGDHPDAILSRALVGPVRPQDCMDLPEDEHCESLAEECRNCIRKLNEIKSLIDALEIRYADNGGFPAALTRFDDGELWQVLRALQTFSDIVVQITPAMAERRAYDVGRGNWADLATLLPILPKFPVQAGVWTDYHDPVMSGLPPDWQPASAEAIKGGFHTLFDHHWRGYWPPYERQDAVRVGRVPGHETEEEGEDPNERGGDPDPLRTILPGSIMHWVEAGLARQEIMRHAKGPYKVYRDDISYGSWREMRFSGFPIIFERVCHATMQAIWNNVVPDVALPRWETDYVEITRPPNPKTGDPGGLLARGVNCAMSAWVGTRRNSPHRFEDDPNGTPTGSPWVIDRSYPPFPPRPPPKCDDFRRYWIDHAKMNFEGQWFWWGQERVLTFYRSKFGADDVELPPGGYFPPDLDDSGNPVGAPFWLFWRWKKWLFLGALFDTDTHSMSHLERLTGDKSAYFPYALDLESGFATRHDYGAFNVLGFAYRFGRARVWGRALQNPSPLVAPGPNGESVPVNLAYAQARVYNPTAWDLWTQNWRVKLVPAGHLQTAEASVPTIAADLERFHDFDTAIELDQLAPVQELYRRMPGLAAVIDEINNH